MEHTVHYWYSQWHGSLTRYVKWWVVYAPGMPGTFLRHWLQRKPLVSDPVMHYDTCATHMPWYMSGSLTRGDGVNVPGIPGACATCNFRYLARGPWHVHVCLLCFVSMWSYYSVLTRIKWHIYPFTWGLFDWSLRNDMCKNRPLYDIIKSYMIIKYKPRA